MKISMDFNLKDDMLTEARRIFELHDEKKQGFISIQSFKNIVKDCIPIEIDHDEEVSHCFCKAICKAIFFYNFLLQF